MLLAGLRDVIRDEAATDCGGKMKVGLAKGVLEENLGLGKGADRRGARFSDVCSEICEVLVLELVGDAGGLGLVVQLRGSTDGLGGRGG